MCVCVCVEYSYQVQRDEDMVQEFLWGWLCDFRLQAILQHRHTHTGQAKQFYEIIKYVICALLPKQPNKTAKQ